MIQISDTHIEEPGDYAYGRFDTAQNLLAAVEAINAIEPMPDLVLHTGDMVHNGSPGRYGYFKELIGNLKPPFFAIPGNHDSRKPFRAAFADKWWMNSKSDFLNYTIEDFPVRIVCCDSVLSGRVQGGFCDERLSWLDTELNRLPGKPTIVALHHPPFASGMSGATSNGLVEGGMQFSDILQQHPQVVRVIAGHSHRPFTCIFGGTIGYAAPTTGYPFALETGLECKLSISGEPPAYSVHMWLGDAGVGQPGLVTHTVPIGDWGIPITLLKGGRRILSAS